MKSMLETVGTAIQDAQSDRPYGLYDYSSYPGEDPPHVVKDERTRKEVYRSEDGDVARLIYERLCREYIADVAIKAMDQWRFAAAGISSSESGQ